MKAAALMVFLVLCSGLASCSKQDAIDRLSPTRETTLARNALSDLRHGRLDALKAQLDPRLLSSGIDEKLKQLQGYFPAGEPRSVKTVGAYTQYMNGTRRVSMTFEYQFDSAWAVGNVVLQQRGEHETIEGIHVERLAQSLEQTNAFSLKDKGPGQWLIVGLACLIPLFCLFAFVLCLRTPIMRRKWLWAIFTLLGVATVRVNWTTGHYAVQLLSVQLFGASVMRPFYGAWTVAISFPLGAIIFLLRRRALMRHAATATPPDLPMPT